MFRADLVSRRIETLQNNVVPDPFADPPPTGDYPDTLVFDPDSQIFVVEMGNPFSDEIDFSRFQDSAGNWGLRLLIRQPASGQSWWYTFTNAGGPGMINASATLAGGEVMLVYNDPLSKTQLEDDPQNLANFVDADYETPVLGPADSPTGFQRPSYNLGQRLIFELQIDVDPDPFVTKWVTYDRLEGLTGDLQISDWDGHYVGEQPTASVGDKWYAQVTVARHTSDASNAPGPFYLSTQGQDFIPGFEPGTPPDATWVANARIGAINKTLSTARQAELANVQLMVANRPVLNPAELATICMFGFTDAATGGSFTERVPAMIGLANGANKAHTTVGGGHTFGIPRAMFLDFAPDAAVPAVPGANIPHAAMVLDLFSTISPQADGIDNDNDDHDGDPTTHADGDGITDGPPELFVPGRINVNTAPLHVLTLAAPLPEASLVDISNLMTMVLNYRDNQFFGGSMFREVTRSTGDLASGLRMTNYRLEPGVLSLAELMWMNPSDNGGFNIDMQFYLDPTNNNATDIGTAGMDVNPLYSELTANGGTRLNGAIDEDAEERIGRFQFLNQVFTTRSDVYTAYVEIRGYPADDYRAGPVERTRFLVVLDRGRITDPADEVRVVAMYRY